MHCTILHSPKRFSHHTHPYLQVFKNRAMQAEAENLIHKSALKNKDANLRKQIQINRLNDINVQAECILLRDHVKTTMIQAETMKLQKKGANLDKHKKRTKPPPISIQAARLHNNPNKNNNTNQPKTKQSSIDTAAALLLELTPTQAAASTNTQKVKHDHACCVITSIHITTNSFIHLHQQNTLIEHKDTPHPSDNNIRCNLNHSLVCNVNASMFETDFQQGCFLYGAKCGKCSKRMYSKKITDPLTECQVTRKHPAYQCSGCKTELCSFVCCQVCYQQWICSTTQLATDDIQNTRKSKRARTAKPVIDLH